MIGEQIQDGDVLVIEARDVARNGEMVIALIDGEAATVKQYQRRGAIIHLVPANPEVETLALPEQRVRTCTYRVCRMVPETKTCCYKVCKMVPETKTRSVCYTVCVPEQVEKEVPVRVCRMVQKTVQVPVCPPPCGGCRRVRRCGC